MRVALVIYDSLERVTGGYIYDRKLVEYLQCQGDQVEIVSLPWRNYLRHLGDNLSSPFRRKLLDLRVDILLQDELNHPSLYALNRWLKQTVRFPLVAIVHHLRISELHSSWRLPLYSWVERRYLSNMDGFIFNSQTTRQVVAAQLADLGAGLPPHVVAYPSGERRKVTVNQQAITQRAQQKGPLRLVFLGNVIRRKGLLTLIQAMSELPAETAVLEVIGSLDIEPAYVRDLRRCLNDLGLQSRVNFLGLLAEDELGTRLDGAHLLVIPSTYEGFGIAYLEGMRHGLPAIATTSGAAGEWIAHGKDGFLIAPGDVAGLMACLSLLCHDRDRLAEMSLAAYAKAHTSPSWEQTGSAVRHYLTTLLEGHRHGGI